MLAAFTTKTLVKFLHFLKRLLIASLLVPAFFILTQDVQIFPGAMNAILDGRYQVPKDVEEFKVNTSDNETIVLWRVKPAKAAHRQVVLMFHGNSATLATFVHMQRWFAAHGFISYTVEYRGYPGSTGFPSEQGLYLDGEAAMNLLFQREQISASDVIVFGNSIGTGPAAYIAQKYRVNTLLLVAPYIDLKSVVAEMPLFGYLSPFLWYQFPTKQYVEQLTDTCVVDAHGKLDNVIPYQHSEQLRRSYQGSGSYTLISSDTARHHDIFALVYKDIIKELKNCLGKDATL